MPPAHPPRPDADAQPQPAPPPTADAPPPPGAPALRRFVVVGCVGAGKSTLARALADRLGLPHVERDRLGEPGTARYRASVPTAVAGDAWIFDGFPEEADVLVYPRAHLVVALDYPRRTVLRRLAWRSLRLRGFRTLRPRYGPLRIARTVWPESRRTIAGLGRRPELASARIVRLESPATARAWLASLPGTREPGSRPRYDPGRSISSIR